MSHREIYGTRDLVFSKWHRCALGGQEPLIDIDWIEYCNEPKCRAPLLLIEAAQDRGQPNKPATVLGALGRCAELPVWCVLYTISPGTDLDHGCACEDERRPRPGCDHGISRFRIRQVWPPPPDRDAWTRMSPEDFRDRVREIRSRHYATHHADRPAPPPARPLPACSW